MFRKTIVFGHFGQFRPFSITESGQKCFATVLPMSRETSEMSLVFRSFRGIFLAFAGCLFFRLFSEFYFFAIFSLYFFVRNCDFDDEKYIIFKDLMLFFVCRLFLVVFARYQRILRVFSSRELATLLCDQSTSRDRYVPKLKWTVILSFPIFKNSIRTNMLYSIMFISFK